MDSKIQSLTFELYSRQWEQEMGEKSKNTENMETHELSDGNRSARTQQKGWKAPTGRRMLEHSQDCDKEKFFNTSRKRKEKSLDWTGMEPVLTLEQNLQNRRDQEFNTELQ